MKFEYKTDRKKCLDAFARFSRAEFEYLNEEGKRNWELVSVVPYDPTTNMDETIYYWKRAIDE